jgi:hypothetical protein
MENLLPAVKSISDLINDFESGKIAVPEIQQQRLRVRSCNQTNDLIRARHGTAAWVGICRRGLSFD